MDDDQKQDGLDWLFDQAAESSAAQTVFQLLSEHEQRENTVIGMCAAPSVSKAEIRDYLITGKLP